MAYGGGSVAPKQFFFFLLFIIIIIFYLIVNLYFHKDSVKKITEICIEWSFCYKGIPHGFSNFLKRFWSSDYSYFVLNWNMKNVICKCRRRSYNQRSWINGIYMVLSILELVQLSQERQTILGMNQAH